MSEIDFFNRKIWNSRLKKAAENKNLTKRST